MKPLTLTVDFNQASGKVKPMHATNNGPVEGVGFGQARTGGFDRWREAGIPFARTHDSSFCSDYGGEHTVDVNAVFPDFDADVNDVASYDFTVTDHYLKQITDCGTKVFYRLGSKIEHEVKKYNTLPPRDFRKWAEICEHIIRHYTEGWANGYHLDIQYWEIWNEPDLDPEDADNKRTWGGTVQEFYEFYPIVARHLKHCFPQLKIGGPASAFRQGWIEGFLNHLTCESERVPLDFFSWHCYGHEVQKIRDRSAWIRERLDFYGYRDTESILNEWNYNTTWDNFLYNVRQIISIKGAAFSAACMCAAQNDTAIDMLMYYDARPSHYNGMFDFYTNAPLKGYYPFKMFNTLYRLKNACHCTVEDGDVYAAAATNGDESAVMIVYFQNNDEDVSTRSLVFCPTNGAERYELYCLDAEHNADLVRTIAVGEVLEMSPNSVYLLRSCKQ